MGSIRALTFEVGRIGDKDIAEQFSENLTLDQQDMAKAATAAYRGGGALASVRGRRNIGAAGFSVRWQNALRVLTFPEKTKKDSLRPAIYMYHKISYAGVFNDGAVVRGGPAGFMWLPVSGLPLRAGRGGEALTPLSFERLTGQQLVPMPRSSHGTPMLGVRIRTNKKGTTKLSLTRLRRGESGKTGVLSTVPVFVGIRQVTQRDKFHLDDVMESVASELGGLYERNMG